MPDVKELIEMIPVGKNDAISRKDLARQLGIRDRFLRTLIHEARSSHPILSNTSNGGYYFPETKEEALEFIAQQYSYITNINQTISAARRWVEQKGQRRLDEIDKGYSGQIAGL